MAGEFVPSESWANQRVAAVPSACVAVTGIEAWSLATATDIEPAIVVRPRAAGKSEINDESRCAMRCSLPFNPLEAVSVKGAVSVNAPISASFSVANATEIEAALACCPSADGSLALAAAKVVSVAAPAGKGNAEALTGCVAGKNVPVTANGKPSLVLTAASVVSVAAPEGRGNAAADIGCVAKGARDAICPADNPTGNGFVALASVAAPSSPNVTFTRGY
jgi:hypothetical protein